MINSGSYKQFSGQLTIFVSSSKWGLFMPCYAFTKRFKTSVIF